MVEDRLPVSQATIDSIPTYMVVADEGWRQYILCGGMYGWAADWLVEKISPDVWPAYFDPTYETGKQSV